MLLRATALLVVLAAACAASFGLGVWIRGDPWGQEWCWADPSDEAGA